MLTFLYILIWLFISAATAIFADQRGRDPVVWFMLGMLLGFFGLLLVFILPPVAEEETPAEAEYELLEPKGETMPITTFQDFLVKDWYYYDQNRVRQGPLSFDLIKKLWQDNEIDQETFVWCEGMDGWKQIEALQTLHTHLQLSM